MKFIACMKASITALKFNSCAVCWLVRTTLMLSQLDTGNKLGCAVPCGGAGVALLNEGENCIYKASGNSMMLSEVVIDVAVSVDDTELLIEAEVGGIL